jgi:hypothetical protein
MPVAQAPRRDKVQTGSFGFRPVRPDNFQEFCGAVSSNVWENGCLAYLRFAYRVAILRAKRYDDERLI